MTTKWEQLDASRPSLLWPRSSRWQSAGHQAQQDSDQSHEQEGPLVSRTWNHRWVANDSSRFLKYSPGNGEVTQIFKNHVKISAINQNCMFFTYIIHNTCMHTYAKTYTQEFKSYEEGTLFLTAHGAPTEQRTGQQSTYLILKNHHTDCVLSLLKSGIKQSFEKCMSGK